MKLKFNSQVCTTIEQSKKLLELGLKPETADCVHFSVNGKEYLTIIDELEFDEEDIPAWSLHRLLCMLYDREGLYPIMPTTAYDDIVDEIENSIERGYFNQECLNK